MPWRFCWRHRRLARSIWSLIRGDFPGPEMIPENCPEPQKFSLEAETCLRSRGTFRPDGCSAAKHDANGAAWALRWRARKSRSTLPEWPSQRGRCDRRCWLRSCRQIMLHDSMPIIFVVDDDISVRESIELLFQG